jgi:hypothetical protein
VDEVPKEQPRFQAVVRGYKPMGDDADVAAVMVEIMPDLVIPYLPAPPVPQADCLRKLKAARRMADGMRLDHAVACITDRWEALRIGIDWRDQWVLVGVGEDGLATFEQVFPDIPF